VTISHQKKQRIVNVWAKFILDHFAIVMLQKMFSLHNINKMSPFSKIYTLHDRYMLITHSKLTNNWQKSATKATGRFRATYNKTAELSQRRRRDAPNIWVPWKVL